MHYNLQFIRKVICHLETQVAITIDRINQLLDVKTSSNKIREKINSWVYEREFFVLETQEKIELLRKFIACAPSDSPVNWCYEGTGIKLSDKGLTTLPIGLVPRPANYFERERDVVIPSYRFSFTRQISKKKNGKVITGIQEVVQGNGTLPEVVPITKLYGEVLPIHLRPKDLEESAYRRAEYSYEVWANENAVLHVKDGRIIWHVGCASEKDSLIGYKFDTVNAEQEFQLEREETEIFFIPLKADPFARIDISTKTGKELKNYNPRFFIVDDDSRRKTDEILIRNIKNTANLVGIHYKNSKRVISFDRIKYAKQVENAQQEIINEFGYLPAGKFEFPHNVRRTQLVPDSQSRMILGANKTERKRNIVSARKARKEIKNIVTTLDLQNIMLDFASHAFGGN